MSNLDCFKLAQVTVQLMTTFIVFHSVFLKAGEATLAKVNVLEVINQGRAGNAV